MKKLALVLGLAACGGSSDKAFSIPFVATVAGAPFSCTQTYADIGTTKTTMSPQDLKMYLHGITLLGGKSGRTALVLDESKYQHGDVALLDFEDGTGTCATESPAVNTVITGKAPGTSSNETYTGIEFTVGVPASLDHLDVTNAVAPLNEPGMFWSWMGGYRYLKLDVGSTQNESWYFHLGAETCSATSDSSIVCKYPNLATVTLPGWTPASTIDFDLARVFATSNLDAQVVAPDTSPGCMSFDGDPECPPLFDALGIGFEDGAPGTQVAFSIQ